MKNHEAYEERRLYPYLAAKFGISVADMEEQHEKLGELERKVIGAWGEGNLDETANSLAEHDRILKRHLIAEEDRVIPLLLSLRTDEYQRYC